MDVNWNRCACCDEEVGEARYIIRDDYSIDTLGVLCQECVTGMIGPSFTKRLEEAERRYQEEMSYRALPYGEWMRKQAKYVRTCGKPSEAEENAAIAAALGQ